MGVCCRGLLFKDKFLSRKLPPGKWKLRVSQYISRSGTVDAMESRAQRNKRTGGSSWMLRGNSFTNEFSSELQKQMLSVGPEDTGNLLCS